MKAWKIRTLLLGIAAMAFFAMACAASLKAPDPQTRVIYMSAVEWKGTTNVAKEPFPADEVLPVGGGYKLVAPNENGDWQAQTYRWEPGTIVVYEGDTVTLKIFGVNGDKHPTVIEDYGVTFEVTRGRLTTVEFKADKTGIFRFVCQAHLPSMTGEIVVLPR